MNNAQLIGIREMHEAMIAQPETSTVEVKTPDGTAKVECVEEEGFWMDLRGKRTFIRVFAAK